MMKLTTILPMFLAVTWGAQNEMVLDMASWPGAPDDPGKGRSPNATGTFTFNGPDRTTADTDSTFEYEIAISVYAEVPRNDTEDNMSAVTVIRLTRDVDPNKVDDGWTTCQQIWQTVEGTDGGQDPGDCSVALPQTCRSGFMSVYDRPGECTLATDLNGNCSPPLDNTAVNDVNPDEPVLLSSWGEPSEPGDEEGMMEGFKEAFNAFWVVQLIWTHEDEQGNFSTRVSGPLCLQASEVAQGSADPNAGERITRHGAGSSAMWGAAMAVMLLAFV